MTSQQKTVFIYLLFVRRTRWTPPWRRHAKSFFSFCKQQKAGRRNELWKWACSAPGGCKWRHCSSHVCAALRCPHLRQTHVVSIHSFTLSACLFPSKTSFWSLHLHLFIISLTYAALPASLTACRPFFHNTFFVEISHIPCQHLFYIVSPFWWSLFFVSPPLFLCWTRQLALLYSEIFEMFSYRSITIVPTQDVLLTLRESCQKMSGFSRDVWLSVCVFGSNCILRGVGETLYVFKTVHGVPNLHYLCSVCVDIPLPGCEADMASCCYTSCMTKGKEKKRRCFYGLVHLMELISTLLESWNCCLQ